MLEFNLKNKKSRIKKTKKVVDEILVKINPKLQAQIDQLYKKVEQRTLGLDEIKTLGLMALGRAKSISQAKKQQVTDEVKNLSKGLKKTLQKVKPRKKSKTSARAKKK